MKKSISVFLLVALIITVSFSGCDKREDGNSNDTTNPFVVTTTEPYVPPDFVPIYQRNDTVVAYVGEEKITQQLVTAMSWKLKSSYDNGKPTDEEILIDVIKSIVTLNFLEENSLPLSDADSLKRKQENAEALAAQISEEDLSKMMLERTEYYEILKQTSYLVGVPYGLRDWLGERISSEDGDIKTDDKTLRKQYEKCLMINKKLAKADEKSWRKLFTDSMESKDKLWNDYMDYLVKNAESEIRYVK